MRGSINNSHSRRNARRAFLVAGAGLQYSVGMDILRGVIERITFHSEETGYTVARLVPEGAGPALGAGREITVVGSMATATVGEWVELHGKWSMHAEYGRQFSVEQMHTTLPATVAGIEKYLGSGLIKGIGPAMARRIVQHFGGETLTVIEQQPDRLAEVGGIGRKRIEQIASAWKEQQAVKEVMLFLQSHGVSTGLATKIYKTYRDDAITIVRSDPYRLAKDVYGIGFLTADQIARSLGLPADSPARVAAGIVFVLGAATNEGHVYLPFAELTQKGSEILKVPEAQVAVGVVQIWGDRQLVLCAEAGGEALPYGPARGGAGAIRLVASGTGLVADSTQARAQELAATNPAVYLSPFHYAEVGVAFGLHKILSAPQSRLEAALPASTNWQRLTAELERESGIVFAPQQREAIRTAVTRRLTILTGGPGTGKTTTVRAILALCRRLGCTALLAAPTGRAAKRLFETTGEEAKTIHRLLEFRGQGASPFQRNEANPLLGDLLIVDESSMIDLLLMNHLLKAVPPGMHLLMVGDADQLPSVGAGNVLRDCIAAVEEGEEQLARRAAVIRLQTIFRQEAGSYIITNAHRINGGEMPLLENDKAQDFFLFRTEDPEKAVQLVVELVQQRIPKRFAIPPGDVQVLSPMHRGVAGVAALNEAIQQAINPPDPSKAEKRLGNRTFRVGDRVMQLRNDYDKEIFNGDVGVITALEPVAQQLFVNFDGRPVLYEFSELDELTHAFAMSVHKSQGSEYAAVVIPVLTTHYMMLQRNLLYTGVTRARRLVVLVGQPRAIAIAVRNDKVTERYSGLRLRLLRTAAA